jgi:diguanylate cyclase (GGDEF)-like protein/PAS domain S-box-containing protein
MSSYYIIPTAIAALVSIVLVGYVWRYRQNAAAGQFMRMLLALAAWSTAASFENLVYDLDSKIFWAKAAYLGVPFLPVLWLFFILDYRESGSGRDNPSRRLLLVVPALSTILAWTNDYHQLIWTDMSLVTIKGSRVMIYEFGPYFWIAVAAYSWSLVLIATVVLLRRLLAGPSIYRAQAGILLAAALLPLLASMVYLSGLGPTGLDLTPLSFSLTTVLVAWALFSYRLIDFGPVAFEAVFNALDDAIIVVDNQGRVTEINPRALRASSRSRSEVVGEMVEVVFSRYPDLVERFGSSRDVHTEVTVDESGRARRLEIRIFPLEDDKGRTTGRIVISRDVTERSVYQSRIEQMAFRDFLTGLPNRRALSDLANKALALARRRKWSVAVLFLDLDNFKSVNDDLGHAAGDLLLQLVASRLQGTVRSEDTLVRLGGDEFALLSQDSSAKSAGKAASRMLEALKDPFEIRETFVTVEASIGVALSPDAGASVEELIAQADVAMYQAKNSPQHVAFFDHTQDLFTQELLKLESEFRRALERNEIFLDYQPILDLRTGETAGLEALARWQHPDRGLLQPSEFIPVLEERSLTWNLDQFVLRRALEEIGPLPFPLSVNLSTKSLLDSNLAKVVQEALEEFNVEPSRLTLEVSEVAISAAEQPARMVEILQKMGVKVAADNFGAGYSSLAHLRRFPYSQLKLDQYIVAGIGRNPEDEGILKAILTVAKSFNLSVIAEGVETTEQLDWLRENGCDLAQGFLISEPLSLTRVRRSNSASESLLPSPESLRRR